MNVREALEKLTEGTALGDMIWATEYARFYAPIIERALRASAEEMAEHGDLEWKAHTDYRAVLHRCVTAGVEAMVEKPND